MAVRLCWRCYLCKFTELPQLLLSWENLHPRQLIIASILVHFPLYKDVDSTIILYWFSTVGQGAGPLILTYINEICSDDSEKRAILVAAANDLAYVVQAVVSRLYFALVEKYY